MSSPSKRLVWQFVAVFLVALNMRMTIAGVGPLLNDIAESRGVSAGSLGLLASIPLLTWAVVSPLAQTVAAKIGMDRTITVSLGALALGTLWRSLDFSGANLWLGTVLIGAALAVANVLMPAIVKRDFGSRTPAVMGVYSAALGGAAGIGTAIAIPVSRAEIAGEPLGWQAGLLATGCTIPIALIAWILIVERDSRRATLAAPASPDPAPRVGRAVWRSRTAWVLACYMGAQSTSFYIFATWIAPIMFSRGATAAVTSTGITLFHLCGMLGSLAAPLVLRFDGRSLLQVALPVIQLVGVLGLILAPSATFVWIVALGLCCGAALSVSLTLIAQRSPDAHTAAAVSGMSQAVGYSIAALGPVLFGLAHDLSGGWALPFVVAMAGLALLFTAGWILRDGRTVQLPT
ncbi:MFS transporter [Leucobacter sp. NPDC015123]|uniref:MFS transporter n=1 Tax=Leucobacter sp. NPDC015123 TaxID=3364129 RepID=UPI0036F47E44